MLDSERIQPGPELAHNAPEAMHSAERPPSTEQQARNACVSELPRLRILVVMDDAKGISAVDHCLSYMSRYDTHTTLAGNLVAARFAISKDDFDAILLDAAVDGGRGLELLAELGTLAHSSPCILIASLQTPPLQTLALECGAAACLAKHQLTAKLLQDVLHSALRGYAFQ